MSKEKTFIRVTNRNIYDKLINVEKHVIKTNGKVAINRWVATTALTLVLILIAAWKFTGG